MDRMLKNGQKRTNLDPEIAALVKEKNRIKKCLQTSIAGGRVDLTLHEEYKQKRNHCNNLIKSHQKKVRGTNFSEESSIGEVWKGVNKIL